MLRIIKVTGLSLSPFFVPGDYVIIRKLVFPRSTYQPGDVIVFWHKDHGRLIKKVTSVEIQPRSYLVAGTNPDSISSAEIGWVDHQSILGKMILHIQRKTSGSK